jgi:hypothetical protein
MIEITTGNEAILFFETVKLHAQGMMYHRRSLPLIQPTGTKYQIKCRTTNLRVRINMAENSIRRFRLFRFANCNANKTYRGYLLLLSAMPPTGDQLLLGLIPPWRYCTIR